MITPATHYTRSGDARIAYQTLGDGDCDLVVITGPASHLERMWEEPRTGRTFRRMADFARLIMFDRTNSRLLTWLGANTKTGDPSPQPLSIASSIFSREEPISVCS
ncbi:MAG: hypothetical protein M3022_07725 [Actinomycetota bacterium]|nr:hypothetical protein [Actinomycetota bacterium]